MRKEKPMSKHSVVIKWSDADNGFIATIPELDGIVAINPLSASLHSVLLGIPQRRRYKNYLRRKSCIWKF